MKKNVTCLFMVGIALLSACKKEDLAQETQLSAESAKVIDVPEAPFVQGFNFNTTRDVQLNIALRANNDSPLAGVVVSVYLPQTNGEAIFKGVTDKSGTLKGKLTLAGSVDHVIIDPAYIGLMRNASAVIPANNIINAIIGGANSFGGDIVAEEIVAQPVSTSAYHTNALLATSYVYPSGYTASNSFVNTGTYPKALGRPVYLDATSDVLDASLLAYINASLPENQPLNTTHPAYFDAAAVSTLNITAKTDVYVTFVSEGASNMNTLAYYTFPTNEPPSVGESILPVLGGIGNITYVFPNASAVGSSGGLKTGDRVKIGNFAAGTSIGFVLIQNGWNGSSGVTTSGRTKFYSGDNLNANKKKQAVLLYDDVHKKFVSSFEDIDRSLNTTDNDFNDLVFFTTSSVAGAIATTNVATIDRGGDTDGDGVQDAQDAFPNDATRAFVTYYPSATASGTIAFEDQWPKVGDYDMNDLVVSYKYSYEVNAQNQVVNLKADYTLLAAGTGYKHGFGIELPVSASAVKSVSGQKLTGNYITMAANGVEAGQSKAVVIPFDNYSSVMTTSSNTYVNTVASQPKMALNTVSLTIAFTSPVTMASLPVSSFNPFLIANLERGREVHLMGYHPTDKANTKLFDTEDDATVPAKNKYYVSVENKPFAMIFNSSFNYPVERVSIDRAYMQYNSWAFSNGKTYADWYSNSAISYRNLTYLYTK